MTKMEENMKNVLEPKSTIAGSVDAIRTSVRDLYNLDEDNYHHILKNKETIEDLQKRLDILTARVRKNRVRTFVGFLMVGGAIYGLNKAVETVKTRLEVHKAMDEVREEIEEDPKKDESDG